MMRTALLLSSLALVALGGCVGAPLAPRPAPGPRAVSVPTTLTGTDARPGTLILGLQ